MIQFRRGFTLIEMLGVIAVMALLSAAASIMLGGSRRKADFQQAVEQLEQADDSARTLARSSDQPVILTIDLSSGTVSRSSGNLKTMLGKLPGDVKLQRERTASALTDYGSAQVSFSPSGSSDSYAFKLASASGATQWIVFSGITGQMLIASDEEIDAIFDQISPRANAH